MQPLFDRASLLERIESDQALLLELLDLYLTVQPARVDALQEAVTQGRLEAVRANAHRLAGAFDSLSMYRAGTLSHALEAAAAANNLAHCHTVMAELAEVIVATTAVVRQARASHPDLDAPAGSATATASATTAR